jgi:hypothetical protein
MSVLQFDPRENDVPVNLINSLRVGVGAFAVSVLLFCLALVFAGRATDFILYSPYRWILPILSSFVLAISYYFRARTAARMPSASARR